MFRALAAIGSNYGTSQGRWGNAINATCHNPPRNKERTPGISIGTTSAAIEIAGTHHGLHVTVNARSVDFVMTLLNGFMELRTTFMCRDWQERGAYYVRVERLTT